MQPHRKASSARRTMSTLETTEWAIPQQALMGLSVKGSQAAVQEGAAHSEQLAGQQMLLWLRVNSAERLGL